MAEHDDEQTRRISPEPATVVLAEVIIRAAAGFPVIVTHVLFRTKLANVMEIQAEKAWLKISNLVITDFAVIEKIEHGIAWWFGEHDRRKDIYQDVQSQRVENNQVGRVNAKLHG